MRRLALAQLAPAALLALVGLSACGPSHSKEIAPPPTKSGGSSNVPTNPFTPARVRIHPLTRMLPAMSEDSPARIDAHVELLDPWGLPVRALGELRFVARLATSDADTLTSDDPNSSGVVVWNIDLSDPEVNATQFYDRVTRTYHIALSDPALTHVRAPLTLDVVFLAPGAATLPATTRIDPPASQNETSPRPE